MSANIIEEFDRKFAKKQASYLMVATLAILDTCSPEGDAYVDEVVERFRSFYDWRISNNKLAERSERKLVNIASLNNNQVKNEMLRNPIHYMPELIDYDTAKNILSFKKNKWDQINDEKIIREIKKIAYKHLYEYYKDVESIWLTVKDLKNLPYLYPVNAENIATISSQNLMKGIHPIIKDDYKAVVVLCTISGQHYSNQWIEQESGLLKYYAEGRKGPDGKKVYNLKMKTNQSIINSSAEGYPIHVFIREKEKELFHYEGQFKYLDFKKDENEDVYFELKRIQDWDRVTSIPDVSREDIIKAIHKFDQSYRNTPEMQDWEKKGSQKYAVLYENEKYPPKHIISIATGMPRNLFSGGEQSNKYLKNRGFEIIELNQNGRPGPSIEKDHIKYDELSDHIISYIDSKGFVFSPDHIKNMLLCLKSKPFIIMAGISGTGKSKVGELFAEALGANYANGRYTLIPVRPDWNDSTDLIGYQNLQGEFVEGPLTRAIRRAEKDRDFPYFVCLDEMNLARVEYYFSDFLSIIESRRFDNGEIKSHTINLHGLETPIAFPDNLYVIGTVNMDETTHPFSRKVLDRANTIEFTNVNLEKYPEDNLHRQEPISINNRYLRSEFLTMKDCYFDNKIFIQKQVQVLKELNIILSKYAFQVGYRVRDEFIFYLLYNKEWKLLSNDVAIDFQIIQKILPRIQGSSVDIENLLNELQTYFEGKYPMSKAKVEYMQGRFAADGFTSFWI